MKMRGQVFNAKCLFSHAHRRSRTLVISKYVSGSLPSMFAQFFHVTTSAFSTFCMPRLVQAPTCAVASALLPSKLVRRSARFIWLTIDSALLLSASEKEDLPVYHTACLHLYVKISQRIILHVCICKRKSSSVSSCMSASAREDLPAYHLACLHLQEKISQRIIPHVCICKGRSPSVSSHMPASAREDLPAYHPACLHLQEKIPQRIIPHVRNCKRRSPSVSSRMPASAREDLPAYHPACLYLQEKISQRIIPHVCICK